MGACEDPYKHWLLQPLDPLAIFLEQVRMEIPRPLQARRRCTQYISEEKSNYEVEKFCILTSGGTEVWTSIRAMGRSRLACAASIWFIGTARHAAG